MHARPRLGAVVTCAIACGAVISGAACILSFPTIREVDDAGDAPFDAGTHDVVVAPPARFCADAGSPYCEDFDGVSFGQDGGPNTRTGNGELVAVTDFFLTPPRSLLPTLAPSSADSSAFLGFTVPIGVAKDFILDAEINVDDASVFTTTPRTVMMLQVPKGDSIAVAFTSVDIFVIAGGVTYDSGVKVPPPGWFELTLIVRLEGRTFGLDIGTNAAFINTRGIGLFPGDAGAPADGGATPTLINAFFGADLPASETNTAIHIDNVLVTPM